MERAARHKKIRAINDQPQIKVNLADCPLYKCPKCEGEAFDRVEMIKTVSMILTGLPHNTYVAKEVFRCINPDCRYVMCSASEPAPTARPVK